jgi:hypothetical protein
MNSRIWIGPVNSNFHFVNWGQELKCGWVKLDNGIPTFSFFLYCICILCPKPGSGFLTRYVVELLSSLFKHTFHMVVTCLRPLYIHVYINKFIQLVMFVVNIQSCYQIVVKQNAILESVLVQKGQLQYNIMVALLLKKDPKAWMVNDKMTLWKESLNSGGATVYIPLIVLVDIKLSYHNTIKGQSWPWSNGSWIYNYLCSQCLSPQMLWVRNTIRVRCTTLCVKVCQWLFSLSSGFLHQ